MDLITQYCNNSLSHWSKENNEKKSVITLKVIYLNIKYRGNNLR